MMTLKSFRREMDGPVRGSVPAECHEIRGGKDPAETADGPRIEPRVLRRRAVRGVQIW